MSDAPRIFTLTQFNQAIEKRIDEFFAHRKTWVAAEVRKINNKGGHRYLELSDSKDNFETARISAFMWGTTYRDVEQTQKLKLDEILVPGNKVLLLMKVTFHPVFGLKAHVLNIDPNYTFGDIERQKQETIQRLKKEGYFGLQQRLRLPPVLKRIALIGSPDTSGFRDFRNELLDNAIFTNFQVKVFPSSVQGDKARKEVVAALKEADRYDADVVVLLRGGGSKMDLHVFNDYDINRTICEMRLPVMTGIGHETDEVIADLVCCRSHITPSAVAQFIYTSIGIFASELQGSYDRVVQLAQQLTSGAREEFESTVKYLIIYTQSLLADEKQNLAETLHQLELVATRLLRTAGHDLNFVLQNLSNQIQLQLRQEDHQLKMVMQQLLQNLGGRLRNVHRTQVDHLYERAIMLQSNLIDQKKLALEGLAEKLDYLNPETLLNKGYTISYVQDKDVDQHQGKLEEEELTTLSSRHIIKSTIKTVKPRQHE